MNVLNVIYNKGKGGLEQVFIDYCTILTQAGHKVTAMVPPSAAIIADLQKNTVPYVTNRSISSSISHLNPYAIWRLRKYLRRIKPDVILLHNARPLALIQRACRGICPVVMVHHGGKEKRILRANHVICITRYMIESLVEHGMKLKQLHYVPNGITIQKNFQESRIPSGNELVIGAIGRLSPEKGFDVLIEALRTLDIPYRAIIAGEGPERETLESLAKGLPIDFPGWVTGEAKEAFFRQCHVLVVPSHREPFGLVILEGWHNSVPVISTATKGASELIEHGKTGILVKTEDPIAIKEALRLLFYGNNQTLIKTAYDHCNAHYSIGVTSDKLLAALEGIVWHTS